MPVRGCQTLGQVMLGWRGVLISQLGYIEPSSSKESDSTPAAGSAAGHLLCAVGFISGREPWNSLPVRIPTEPGHPLSILSPLAGAVEADLGCGNRCGMGLKHSSHIPSSDSSCILLWNFYPVITSVRMWVELVSFLWFYPQPSFHCQNSHHWPKSLCILIDNKISF